MEIKRPRWQGRKSKAQIQWLCKRPCSESTSSINREYNATNADADETMVNACCCLYEVAIAEAAWIIDDEIDDDDNATAKDEQTCVVCHEYARIPFARCNFCGDAPSYHHG